VCGGWGVDSKLALLDHLYLLLSLLLFVPLCVSPELTWEEKSVLSIVPYCLVVVLPFKGEVQAYMPQNRKGI
jgi:hypothetical protein